MHVWPRAPSPAALTLSCELECSTDIRQGLRVKSGGRGRPPHTMVHIWPGLSPRCKLPRNAILSALLGPGISALPRPHRRGFGSAYNARPKLVVIVVIDQFRGDYLERYRDQWGEGGFRLLLDHGANFTDCNYDYANTRTAPGHATLLTGTYSNGHGIMANEWWDPAKKRLVTSVEDDATKLVGIAGGGTGLRPTTCSPTPGRRTQTRYPGQGAGFRDRVKRPRRHPAGRLRRRWRLLDRPEDRHLDYFHLLSQRTSQMGAGFQ